MLTLGEVTYLVDTNGSAPKERALLLLTDTFRRGGKLLLCGNGGSAADCEHIVAELVNGMTHIERAPGLPAISLCSNTSLITAIANDRGADQIFSQQVICYGKREDVLLAISTSGQSTNVLRALIAANCLGMRTIGLTGPLNIDNGEFVLNSDVVISCPGGNTAEIQEQHIKVYHELCKRLEEEFFS